MLLAMIAVPLIYQPVWNAGFVDWDDDLNFEQNSHFRQLDSQSLRWMFRESHAGHWTPLTWLSFALEYQWVGLSAPSFHRINLALHVLVTVVVFFFVRRFLRWSASSGHSTARPDGIAGLSALLFAIHPLRVESVAWITERRDLLSALFLLLAANAQIGADLAAPGRRRLLAVFWALLSGGAKAWVLVLPAALLALDSALHFAQGRGSPFPWRRRVLEKIGLIVVAVVVGFLAWRAQGDSQGTLRDLAQHGVFARVMQAAYGLVWYVHKTIVPVGLAALHELPNPFEPLSSRFLITAAIALAGAVLLAKWRRQVPWCYGAFLAYGIMVSPVLGLVQAGPQLVADRYAYLSTLPLTVLAVVLVRRSLRLPGPPRGATLFFLVAAVFALGITSHQQAHTWQSPLRLWTRAVEVHPNDALPWHNLGHAQVQASNRAESDSERELALAAAESAYWKSLSLKRRPSTLVGLAVILEKRTSRAIGTKDREAALGQALQLVEEGLDRARAENQVLPQWILNRGVIHFHLGELDKAIRDFEQGVSLLPTDGRARRQLIQILLAANRPREALLQLEVAFRTNATDPTLWSYTGAAHDLLSEREQACHAYEKAISLLPPTDTDSLPKLKSRLQSLRAPPPPK